MCNKTIVILVQVTYDRRIQRIKSNDLHGLRLLADIGQDTAVDVARHPDDMQDGAYLF